MEGLEVKHCMNFRHFTFVVTESIIQIGTKWSHVWIFPRGMMYEFYHERELFEESKVCEQFVTLSARSLQRRTIYQCFVVTREKCQI